MAKPPPLNVTVSADAPIDRALGHAAAGEVDKALRFAVPLVKGDLSAPLPLFVLASALLRADQLAAATLAFETAADRASDNGNLPLALAAIAELRSMNAEVDARAHAIAKVFAKGSPRLKAGTATPPPVSPPDVHPLPATLAGPPLVEAALETLEYARAAFEAARAENKAPIVVPPQGVFSSLSAPSLAAFIGALEVSTVPTGHLVIAEGAPGEEAFILARGELEVVRESAEGAPLLLARLGSGAVFGEMALLTRSPRTASVVAARPSVVLTIRVDKLEAVAEQAPEVGAAFASYAHRRMVSNLVRTSPLLRPLSASERQALIERFSARTFETGERIIVQGEESDGLHVIASGEVNVVRRDGGDDVLITSLGSGEVLGEVSLVFRRASNADVVATHSTMTLHLPRARFMEIVREHPTLLAQLYELAAQRDEETSSIVADEASDAEELMI